MKVLVFDTETNGLVDKNVSIFNTVEWPHILQLSYIMYDISTNDIAAGDNYIKIDKSVKISDESYEIHKISRDKLNKEGVNITNALKEFNARVDECDLLVGHNLSFDRDIIFVECLRNHVKQNFTQFYRGGKKVKPEYCTMNNTKKFCGFLRKNSYGHGYYKNPKLSELYNKLFPNNPTPTNLHNSLQDSVITLACYLKYQHNIDLFKKNETAKFLYKCCEK